MPQGGKASPELWKIGMNGMMRNLGKCSLAYADDLGLVLPSNTKIGLKKKIEEALNVINVWCESTGLSMSSPKSQLMNVGKEIYDEPVLICGERVQSAEAIKYLGVMLSAYMKWRDHFKLIDEKISKFIRVFSLLKFMNKDLKLKQKKILYKQV